MGIQFKNKEEKTYPISIKQTSNEEEIILIQCSMYFDTDVEKNMALIGYYMCRNRADAAKTLSLELMYLESTLSEYVKNKKSKLVNKRFESVLRYVSGKTIIKSETEENDIGGLAIVSNTDGEIKFFFESINEGMDYASSMDTNKYHLETYVFKTYNKE